MPFEEKSLSICSEVGFIGCKDRTTSGRRKRLVSITRYHIEIRTREIAFVIICRFENRSCIAGERIGTFFAQSMVLVVIRETGAVTSIYFAVRQVAAEIVDACIGGINMEKVGLQYLINS